MKKQQNNSLASFLFHQGTNFCAYEYMGIHYNKIDNSYTFRVWAPHADKVFLVSNFNSWSEKNPMKRITENGIYEIEISENIFNINDCYKYKIVNSGKEIYKADPYAFYCENPPKTASKFFELSGFKWEDEKFLNQREVKFKTKKYSIPMNIYELHPASFKRNEGGEVLSFRELAVELSSYVKQMGYTHIELMPIMEHPYDGSWGYQICSYFVPSTRFGNPHDFMYFVNCMHKAEIGVILDWVPAHFPKDAYGLYEFDGEPLYEFQGEDRMEHKVWGTRKFDIARNEVQSFLISNAYFWIKLFHIDGLRIDAVAAMLYLDYDKIPGEWNPNVYGGRESLEAISFFKKLGSAFENDFPDVLLIAEESTAWGAVTKSPKEGGLGFNFKWNMGWMNDILSYCETDPLYRKYCHEKVNFSLMYAFSDNFILPISHDEVVHGKKSLLDKMPGDYWQKFANDRAFMTFMMTHPGKKLLFMGCEIGQFREWDYEDSVEWFLLQYPMHKKFQKFVHDLNHFYLKNSQLYEIDDSWEGFQWICADNNEESILSYRRINKKKEELIVIINFTPIARENCFFGLPYEGTFVEVINSDDEKYGGSGVVNIGEIKTQKLITNNMKNSLEIRLPPLGAAIFKKI